MMEGGKVRKRKKGWKKCEIDLQINVSFQKIFHQSISHVSCKFWLETNDGGGKGAKEEKGLKKKMWNRSASGIFQPQSPDSDLMQYLYSVLLQCMSSTYNHSSKNVYNIFFSGSKKLHNSDLAFSHSHSTRNTSDLLQNQWPPQVDRQYWYNTVSPKCNAFVLLALEPGICNKKM